MASPWTTYTPHTPPPRDVQLSNVSPELVASDASLVSIGSGKRHSLERAGRNLSVSSIPPFTSTGGEGTDGKAAPIIVSATSFGVDFRQAGLPTRTSVDKQHTSAPPQAPHSPVSNDGEQYVSTLEAANIARLVKSIMPMHKHGGPQSSLSSSTFERDVLAASPAQNTTHVVAPMSAASDATPPSSPPPPPDSITPPPITSTDVSITDSPNTGASRTPTITLALIQSPEYERNRTEKPTPRRSGTSGTSGSGSTQVLQSRYTDMVFENVPRSHSLLSSLFTWILLAGFVVLPGTFSTIESIQSGSGEVQKVLHEIRNLPLMAVAFGCCAFGALGMLFLWWRWAHNYVWLLNSIFVPGLLNGLSGLVSTFASIYGVQKGTWGASSIATLASTGACAVICGLLTAIYSLWKLDKVKRRHEHDMAQMKNGDDAVGAVNYF